MKNNLSLTEVWHECIITSNTNNQEVCDNCGHIPATLFISEKGQFCYKCKPINP